MSTVTVIEAAARPPDPDRRGRAAPPRGVSRRLDLEDPLPRGRGAAEPAADTRRLPAVQRARRRAAGDDPAAAARRVPAAARDPRRAADPGGGRAEAAQAGGAGGAGRPDRLRGALPPRRRQAELARSWRSSACSPPSAAGADKRYPETDADIAIVCAQLTRFGVDARHLRTFRTATDRQASLLEQLIAPALRSRNAERRAAGLSDLQALTDLAQELAGLLLWREVREIAADDGDRPADAIREVEDFPTPGVGFKDITPLLADPKR